MCKKEKKKKNSLVILSSKGTLSSEGKPDMSRLVTQVQEWPAFRMASTIAQEQREAMVKNQSFRSVLGEQDS
jgi:hypothetical protein